MSSLCWWNASVGPPYLGCTRTATETCSSSFCSLRLPPSTGAGIFVTTVVAGSVALVKPFVVASRPFLRDVSFYMVAVFWTFLMLFRRTTNLGETLGTVTHTHLHIQWSSQEWREQQCTMWMDPLFSRVSEPLCGVCHHSYRQFVHLPTSETFDAG